MKEMLDKVPMQAYHEYYGKWEFQEEIPRVGVGASFLTSHFTGGGKRRKRRNCEVASWFC